MKSKNNMSVTGATIETNKFEPLTNEEESTRCVKTPGGPDSPEPEYHDCFSKVFSYRPHPAYARR